MFRNTRIDGKLVWVVTAPGNRLPANWLLKAAYITTPMWGAALLVLLASIK